jgi:hypothetical protein
LCRIGVLVLGYFSVGDTKEYGREKVRIEPSGPNSVDVHRTSDQQETEADAVAYDEKINASVVIRTHPLMSRLMRSSSQ